MKLKLLSVVALMGFTSLPLSAGAQKLDPIKQINALMKNGQSEKDAFDSVISATGSAILSENKKQITFYYYNDLESSQYLMTNLAEDPVKMKKQKNIFSAVLKIPSDTHFVTYKFVSEYQITCPDPYKKYCWTDKDHSGLVLLDDTHGALVEFTDVIPKGKYEVLKDRNFQAYLPSEYLKDTEKKFPVLYILDGQQIWDSRDCAMNGWKSESTMEKLAAAKECESCIIVAVNNSMNRDKEYAGFSKGARLRETHMENPTDWEQQSLECERMIVEDLVPYIDAHLRTIAAPEARIICGSSYGACYSAYLLSRHQDVFKNAGLFSGGLEPYEDVIREDKIKPGCRIYMDIGDADMTEQELFPGTQEMLKYLESKGYKQNVDLLYKFCPGATHNEFQWSKRMPDFYRFILPVEKQ